MVNGMGGINSKHYHDFKQYCCETYNILRKSSNLIISLFTLMADASIHDLAIDPEKGILRVAVPCSFSHLCAQLQEKFRLEMNDEEASQTMLMLINESVSALFAAFLDSLHGFLQYWV